MTFILNILHRDFSLLVCDKQGNASGTLVLQSPGGPKITLTAPKITLNGVNKLFTDRHRTLAAGVAGSMQDHPYTSKLKDAESVVEALDMVHAHMSAYLIRGDRRVVIEAKPVMQNQGLATYFDVGTAEFFTDLFIYTAREMTSRLFCAQSDQSRLIHVGSGSAALEGAVGLGSINAFLATLKGAASPASCLEWIAHAYNKTSEKAVGCGKEFTALCATRGAPTFSELVT
jgi:hypothetical protein